jgi:hypothetical protein
MSERCYVPGNQRRAPPSTADLLQACRMPIGAIVAPSLSNALQQQHFATAAMLSNAAKSGVLIL